jgi:hypothetical protein
MSAFLKQFFESTSVRNHEEQSGGTVGLTDQTTPDLNGIVIPLPSALDAPARK